MIRGLLYKLHKWVWDYGREDEINIKAGTISYQSNPISSGLADIDGLRFTVMPAMGGTIVQVRLHDSRKADPQASTYIIPQGDDVATEIGRIVSMELIKI
jgi:hypothetical protein